MRMNTEQVPKPCDANADPASTRGRLASCGKRAKEALHEFAGALVTACSHKETCGNTGSPIGRSGAGRANWRSARRRPGRMGWRRGPYDRRSRVMPVEGRGLGSRAVEQEAKARRLA
jgi:hypothetical protein